MKNQPITSKTVDVIRHELNLALIELEERLGIPLKFSIGHRASYSEDIINFKLNVFLPGVNGETKLEADWKKNCWKYNMTNNDFGRTFNSEGNKYTIVGCKPKARTRPIIGKNINTGQEFVFPVNLVKFD